MVMRWYNRGCKVNGPAVLPTPGTRTTRGALVIESQSSASAQDSPLAPQANAPAEPRQRCAGCGEPAKKLAPLHGARTGAELRALPLMGPCCNPRLRPSGATAGALAFTGDL